MKAPGNKSTANQRNDHNIEKYIQWVTNLYSIHRWKIHLTGYNFVADNTGPTLYFHSFSRCWLPNLQNSEWIRIYSRSGSSKVIHLGVSRKRICDLLLIVSYRFRDIDVWMVCFTTPPLFNALARGNPLEVQYETHPSKTRGTTLWWKLHNPNLNWLWVWQTDRRTGGR